MKENRMDEFSNAVVSLAGVFHGVRSFLVWIWLFYKEVSSPFLRTVGCNSNLY